MSDDRRNHSGDAVSDKSAVIRQRDTTIERLEQSLAEERQHSAELRSTIEELRFQTETLERSYSNQLEDTRMQLKSAETKITERGARIVELDQAREDAIQLMTETKFEIDRLTAERDQLRRQLASRDGWQIDGADGDVDIDPNEGTINTLMDDASWLRKKGQDKEKPAWERMAEEAAAEETAGDMIDPDLVLSAKKARDSG